MRNPNENSQAVQIAREIAQVVSAHIENPVTERDAVCIPIICDPQTGSDIIRNLRKELKWARLRYNQDFLSVGNIMIYCDPDAAANPVALRGNTCIAYVLGEIPGTDEEQELFQKAMNMSLMTARTSGFECRIFHV